MKTTSLFHRISRRAALALAVASLCSPAALVQAQPSPDRPGQPPAEGRRPQRESLAPGGQSGFRGGQGQPMMEQVLTEDQRDSLRQTMEAQRDQMRTLQEKIRDARKAMMTAAFAEDYQEKAVRAKALEVAKLEAEVTVMRLKAIAEVQPALSKEQLEKIMNPPPPQGMGPGGNEPRPNRPPAGPRPPQGEPQ